MVLMSPLNRFIQRLRTVIDQRMPGRDLSSFLADPAWLTRLPLGLRAVLQAVWAALISGLVVQLVVLVGWLAGAAGNGSGWAAFAFGLDLWLFIQGVPLRIAGETVSLVPWLLVVVPLAGLSWPARRLVAELPPTAGDDRPVAGMRRDVAFTFCPFVGGYALTAVLVALIASSEATSSVPLLAPFGPAVLAAGTYLRALRAHLGTRARSAFPRLAWHWNVDVPACARVCLRPALVGTGVLFGAGAVLVLGMVVAGFPRISVIASYVDPGAVGGVLLALLQFGYLPAGAAWAVGFFAGPGFSAGQDTLVSWGNAQLGPLPLIPVLGALPDPGELPQWTYGTAAIPVLAGALVAWLSLRTWLRAQEEPAARTVRMLSAVAVISAVLTGVLTAVACALCSGSLGGQRLAHVGVNPFLTGGALVAELLLGAVLALAVTLLSRARITRAGAAAQPVSQHR